MSENRHANAATPPKDGLLGLKIREVDPETRQLVEQVHAGSADVGPTYLLGRNEHSQALIGLPGVAGVIDDFCSDAEWQGKPVVRGEDVPKESIVVNCVLMARNNLALARAKELGVRAVLSYGDFLQVLPDAVEVPGFSADTRVDVADYLESWQELRNSLADEESKAVLDQVLGFRLTCDQSHLESQTYRPKEQYFEDFLGLGAGEVFVDCGGFDGDTTEEFCKRCPEYDSVYFFEPSETNLKKAKERLNGLSNINYVKEIASDKSGTMCFDADSGSASAVSDSGTEEVQATTIDERVEAKVSFVKMDIEGWEINALTGCRRHIAEDHPKLAIAVYHHPSDFRVLKDYILGIRPDYKLYLRHYTEGWTETVMYFVPA